MGHMPELAVVVHAAIRSHVDADPWAMAEKVEASEQEIILRLIEGA